MQTTRQQTTVTWFWIVPLLLWVALLTIPQLVADAAWTDEAYTYQFSGLANVTGQTLVDTIVDVAKFDLVWPPGYYIFQNMWRGIVGASVYANNVFPMLIGLLSIALMYRLTTLLFNSAFAGLIGAALLATSAFHVHYLHETRGYTLYILVCLLVAYIYWRYITIPRPGKRHFGWALTLAVAFALYTHYITIAFLGGIFAYHILVEWRNPHSNHPTRRADIVRAFINGGLLFTPWVAVFILNLTIEADVSRGEPFWIVLNGLLVTTTNHLIWLSVPLILLSLFFYKERRTQFLWIWLIISTVFTVIIDLGADFLFHPRHLLPLIPILILLITRSLIALPKSYRSVALAFVGLWMGAGAVYINTPTFLADNIVNHVPSMPFQMVAEMQSITDNCVTPDDAVIFSLDTAQYELDQAGAFDLYYYISPPFSHSYLTALVSDSPAIGKLPTELQTVPYEDRVAAIIEQAPAVWLLTRPDIPNTAHIIALDDILDAQGYQVCSYFWQTDALNGWVYSENCETISQTCTP